MDAERARELLTREREMFRDCFRGSEVLVTDLLGGQGRVFLKEPEAVIGRVEKILHNLLADEASEVSRLFFERLASVPTVKALSLPAAEGATEGSAPVSWGAVIRTLETDRQTDRWRRR